MDQSLKPGIWGFGGQWVVTSFLPEEVQSPAASSCLSCFCCYAIADPPPRLLADSWLRVTMEIEFGAVVCVFISRATVTIPQTWWVV